MDKMERTPPPHNEKGKQNYNKFEKSQSNEEGYKPQFRKDDKNRDFQKNKYNNNNNRFNNN